MSDPVVLLHGLARTRLCMAPIAAALKQAGFEPHLVGFASRRYGLKAQAEALAQRLSAMPELNGRVVHFVGFSLGGVMARALSGMELPFTIGRIVQIGAPNRGSRAARHFHWPGIRHFMGPVMADLFPDSPALSSLPQPRGEIGVIIGRLGFHPLLPHTWLNAAMNRQDPKSSDGVVECESADWPTATDRFEVFGSHSFLPYKPDVIRASVAFLRHGRFAA